MKIKPLFIIFLIVTFTSYSQEFKIGLKGGLNLPTTGNLLHLGTSSGGGNNVDPANDFLYKPDKDFSYHFGAFASIGYNNFFLRPEVNFTLLNASYPLAYKTSTWEMKRFDFPVLIGMNISNNMSIYAGPVFSYINDFVIDGTENPILYKKNTIGAAAGVLVEMGRFGIDFRYEYGISKYEEQRVDYYRVYYGTNVAYLQENNLSQFIISVHVNIFQTNSNGRNRGKRPSWSQSNCF